MKEKLSTNKGLAGMVAHPARIAAIAVAATTSERIMGLPGIGATKPDQAARAKRSAHAHADKVGRARGSNSSIIPIYG
jgi:orotidine-5'-phosphate decarboxylase